MTRSLRTTRRFERDLKTARRRGKDLARLWTAVEMLAAGERLPQRYRPHKLSGAWRDFMECHLEPDWLLIWREEKDALTLVRTGSHADLFE